MDASYVPAEIETRHVYGVSLEQRRNDAKISAASFTKTVSKNTEVSPPLVNQGQSLISMRRFLPLLSPISPSLPSRSNTPNRTRFASHTTEERSVSEQANSPEFTARDSQE